MALGAVLDERELAFLRERAEALQVGDASVQVDGQQELRGGAGDPLGARGVEREGVGVDVRENRLRAGLPDAGERRGAGVGGQDDLVLRRRAGGRERQRDRLGAVGAGDDVRDADRPREFLLEARDFLAEDEPAPLEDPRDGGIDRGPLAPVVLGQGAERDAGREAGGARAHAASTTSPPGSRVKRRPQEQAVAPFSKRSVLAHRHTWPCTCAGLP